MRVEPQHFKIGDWEIRPNICTEVGDKIVLHKHDHEHMTLCWRGKFRYKVGDKTGELASCGLGAGVTESRMLIPANEEHEFEVIELESGVAVLECLWPDGVK